jgi:(2Fe-2S) ferredoxin
MIKRKSWFSPFCFIGLLLVVALLTGCIRLAEKDGASKPSSPVTHEDLVIKLERTACFGKCPVYSLMIKGDGTVIYAGVDFVKTKGIQETKISMDAVDKLLMEFEKSDYFSLKDSYTGFGKSDMPSANTSISLGGQTKAIKHYHGDLTAPKQLTELENKIDELVNSTQWIK